MNEISNPNAADDIEAKRVRSEAAIKTLAQVAWLAIAAGLAAQILVVFARAGVGMAVAPPLFLAELAQGVSWSILVCGAIAIGTLIAKAPPARIGLIGLLAAPFAWAAAKGIQKSVQAFAGAPQDQLTTVFWIICIVKGVQYAALGAAVSHLVRQPQTWLSKHIVTGALIGVVGASFVLSLQADFALRAGAALPMAKAVAIGTNETLFPIACSLVIYFANQLNQHIGVIKAAS